MKVSLNRLATGNSSYVSLLTRRGTADYRGRVRFGLGGTTFLQAARAVGDTETFMGSEATALAAYGPGTSIWVRMQVSGASPTTIRMHAWVDGLPEPSTWPYTVTDSTAAPEAGTVGLQVRLSSSATSAPTVFSFDGFRVVTLS